MLRNLAAGVVNLSAKASDLHTEEMKQLLSQLPAVLEQSLGPSTVR